VSTSPITPLTPEEPSSPSVRSPFLPLLLLVIAFLGWTILQTTELFREHFALNATRVQQAAPLAQAQKIRAATDSLASKTEKLAEGGNASAQIVIAQLKQRGITINPNASTPTPP
jgi:hypothetical protein